MLNQSFTVDNFKNIYDIENRKNNIKMYLGSKYINILNQIKFLQNDILQIKRKKSNDRTNVDKENLVEKKKEKEALFITKKEIQYSELEKISKIINGKDFKFILKHNGDNIFVIQNTKEAFFAIKQLQYNIRNTFKVKQSSRHLILSQIKLLLNDNSPKYVIRTDVSKFFESITQDKLHNKINDNTLLSSQSKKFISQILDEYNNKKDKTIIEENKGIPRGVGISSYLSELYMKNIDKQICNLQDVIYYARYVDDIFIIISPRFSKDINNYYKEIKEIVKNENLELKDITNADEKCNLLDFSENSTSNNPDKVTYLGYNIYFEQRPNGLIETTFGLSEAKKNKLENKVLNCIKYFNKKHKYDIKTARKELLLCLRFLCTNTKLKGAKSRVKTGIFYSNDLLDECHEKDISAFDQKLNDEWLLKIDVYDKIFKDTQSKEHYVADLIKCINTRNSFYKGFKQKTYHTFSNNDFKVIKRILNEKEKN